MYKSKIDVIPCNPVPGKPYSTSQRKRIDQFKDILRAAKVDVTERRPMGDDIAAACGQLAAQNVRADAIATPITT